MEQLHDKGRVVKGEQFVTDASTAAEVALYDQAGEVYALAADEYLAIETIEVVTDTAADVHVFFDDDDDNVPDAGETIVRGDFSANGGIATQFPTPRRGQDGGKPHVVSDVAAAVKITLSGLVRKVLTKTGPVGTPAHNL